MLISFAFVFFLFSIFWRFRPFLYNDSENLGTDTAFHLYYIELIKKNKNQVPIKNEKAFGGPNECTYPAFYHKILSYIPLSFLKKHGNLSPLIYDFLSGALLSFSLNQFYEISLIRVFLLLGIYLLFPSLIFHSIGPRSYSLTPRNFSQFLYVFAYVFIIFYFEKSSFICLQLSAICIAISALASKFSIQYFVFICILLSLFLWSISPIIFLFNVVLWLILIGRKTFFRQVKGQIQHTYWYIKEGIKFIEERFMWVSFYKLISQLQFRSLWQIVMFHNPLTKGAILNFPILLSLFFIEIAHLNQAQYFSFILVLGSFFLWIATQFSVLRAFGEPERYIEYSVPAFIFLAFSDCVNYDLFLFMAFYSILFSLYSLKINNKKISSVLLQDTKNMQDMLKSIKSKRILCTLNNETYLFASIEDEIVVGFFSNNVMSNFYKYFYDIYPDVNPKNLISICNEFKVTHILMNKKRKLYTSYFMPVTKVLLENEHYKLIKI